MKSGLFNKLLPIAAILMAGSVSYAGSARITGGLCISQGNWLAAALQQSDIIAEAINSLSNDPNCKGLTEALRNSPKFDAGQVQDEETTSYANLNGELQALSQYMKPSPDLGMPQKDFKDIVFHTVFNKSYQSIRDIQNSTELSKFNAGQIAQIANVSLKLKAFLKKSKDVANMTMSTASNIMSAIPNSELCLHNKPSVAAAIFGAVAHSAASLTTGGEINGVGKFVGDLLDFQRNMKYMKALTPIELERFHTSVSCLVESTSESYCSINDAEQTLDLFKEINLSEQQKNMLDKVLVNPENDVVASPLSGLVLMMRDIPTIQAWMQKVLFGINPKISAEATMKNDYWGSYLMFIQSINSLMADFNDKEQLYYATTRGQNVDTKLSQVKDILEVTQANINGGPKGGVNFFNRAMQAEAIPFFLINVPMPATFNVQTLNFDTFWLNWVREQSNGFADPDQLLKTMRTQLWDLMDKAQIQANEFFATRMIVDPQNLMTEAMRGPGVSAYQGFYNLKHYLTKLIVKLETGAADLQKNPLQQARAEAQLAQIPLIQDSIERIDKILNSLKEVGKISSLHKEDIPTQIQSQTIMSAIYETANMMVSRDSLFGTRMATILQADISDTLYRNRHLTNAQLEYFMSVGPQIVSKLSGYFAINPVNQRADISAAKLVHLKNLESVEELFAKTIFGRIAEISCATEGGYFCSIDHGTINPADRNVMATVNEFIVNDRKTRSEKGMIRGGLWFRVLNWMNKPTEDSTAHDQVKAKLCMQSLAFKSRDAFKEVCRGAMLLSDFADKADTFKLNLNFDTALNNVSQVASVKQKGSMDMARTAGVCSLRTYLRKNHIFYMYREYMEAR